MALARARGAYDRAGGQFLIRIANRSPRVLNLAVLNLTPSWAVAQIYPGPDDTDYLPIDPGEERWLPTVYTATLRDDYAEGTEVLKIFGTLGTTSFLWLELPPLDQPLAARKGEAPADPLEQMLSRFTDEDISMATKDTSNSSDLTLGTYSPKGDVEANPNRRIVSTADCRSSTTCCDWPWRSDATQR